MQATMATVPSSKTTPWVGRIISAIPVLFLIFDAVIKLMNIQPVVDSSIVLGLPVTLAPTVGTLLLACLALYLLPRTSVLGAILLTGYLGGATATHVRIGDPFYAPVLLGVLIWGGLVLRDARLRALLPLRR